MTAIRTIKQNIGATTAGKSLKVAGYARVSRPDQDISLQVEAIRAYCERAGYVLFNVYQDAGISGAEDSRPAFNALVRDMRRVKFNCVMVTKLDRMGRSLKHIVTLFEEFNKLGVHFIATTQNIDTSSSGGKLQMQMLAAFAEFEGNLISERTKDAIADNPKVGKRGKDKKPRKKRGVLRGPIFEIAGVGQ